MEIKRFWKNKELRGKKGAGVLMGVGLLIGAYYYFKNKKTEPKSPK
jgi:hypothetical protein